ncbi:DNA-binding protein [Nocardioides sp. BGMRC 2183]|nr:DNA-binding protein [Nocardioides sp. BGMRC 2183]
MDTSLAAPYTTAFGFERTVGPQIGAFLAGLRARRLLGVRVGEDRVLCPVAEFDPVTSAATGDLVELEPSGTVTAWTWVDPREGWDEPIDSPYAWALIRIDGADNTFFHRVDTGGDPARMTPGLRVRVRWAADPVGSIEDIVCFEPPAEPPVPGATDPGAEIGEPVATIEAPFHVDYTYVAGVGRSVYLRGMAERRFLARRCPGCHQVYFPAPDHCARCLQVLDAPFEISGTGTISTFCIVNLPFPGQLVDPPYVVAYINLDGTGNKLQHRVLEVAPDAVAVGMQVEPVWAPETDLEPSLASVRYFRPVDPTLRVPVADQEARDA